ncbi:hypothetical protein LCGC14_2135760 [marine sediment metagenome]|uniref:Uncharacterized protein n=1 Tax=marine sediment metagenome TaxID=412755 RepID=A0A0F9EM97_9ZZZZ
MSDFISDKSIAAVGEVNLLNTIDRLEKEAIRYAALWHGIEAYFEARGERAVLEGIIAAVGFVEGRDD